MSFSDIQSALAQRLNTVPGIPAIYWGGVRKKPTKGTNWVRPTMVPFESELAMLSGQQDNSGIYQVAVFTDLGRGEGPLLDIMDAIKEHFKAQTILTESGTCVFVTTVSVTQILPTDAWLQGNVEIRFKSIET